MATPEAGRGEASEERGGRGYADEYGYVDEPAPIHVVDLLNVVLRRRWLIASGVFLVVLLVGVVSKKMTPTFTTSAKFLPSKDPDLSSRMTDYVGANDIGSFEKNATSPFYLELLRSKTFLERVVTRKFRSTRLGGETDLIGFWEVEGDSAGQRLAKATETLSKTLTSKMDARTGILTVTFSASEPALAADVLNAVLDELVTYSQEVRGLRTKQNREFIEKQLAESQKRLSEAENHFAEFSRRNVRVVGLPEVEAERDKVKRVVTIQEEVYLTLRKQLELARIEEQEKRTSIEVIDRAVPPIKKSAPSVRKNVMLAAFVAMVLFVGLAFLLEWSSSIDLSDGRNRELVEHLRTLRGELVRPWRIFRKRGTGAGLVP